MSHKFLCTLLSMFLLLTKTLECGLKALLLLIVYLLLLVSPPLTSGTVKMFNFSPWHLMNESWGTKWTFYLKAHSSVGKYMCLSPQFSHKEKESRVSMSVAGFEGVLRKHYKQQSLYVESFCGLPWIRKLQCNSTSKNKLQEKIKCYMYNRGVKQLPSWQSHTQDCK